MEQEFDNVNNLESKLMNDKNIGSKVKEEHKFYGYLIGKIKSPNQLSKYKIDDPNCEVLLKNSEFYIEKAATCFQEQSLSLFFSKKYTSQQLIQSIRNYNDDGSTNIDKYIKAANNNMSLFKDRYRVDDEEAFGCCLALSCYTGVQSERMSRTCSIIIKLEVKNFQSKVKNTSEYQSLRCINHWLFKALNRIPLHWGQVTRCVNLDEKELQMYKPGNIVTWLQFSSSSYGKLTGYFAVRNTRFVIYSLSGRCIDDFSNYKGRETEVLFKPFSHFMVLSRTTDGPIQYVYMRQIFIGQSEHNVLWVDDNISDLNKENKQIMEKAMVNDPFLSIIPKNSTECAMAFLQSPVGQHRNSNEFRILSDMNRNNEFPSHNAGARLIQACKKMCLTYPMLIFTSNKQKGQQELANLDASMNNVKVTVHAIDVLDFFAFKK